MQALDAVHSWHQVIHENRVVLRDERALKAFFCACHRVRADLRVSEQFLRDHEVRFVVVDDEHERVGGLENLLVVLAFVHDVSRLEIEVSDRLFAHDCLVERDDER